jgi:hypothetical protein
LREHAVPFEPLDPSEVIWGGRAIARAIGRTTDNPIEPELIVAAIDAAEELRDPLDRLVEKTAIDPGAPFAPDVLERLVWPAVRDRRCAFIVIGKRKLILPDIWSMSRKFELAFLQLEMRRT